MYLNNPKKLLDDMYAVKTIFCHMEAANGDNDTGIHNLISILNYQIYNAEAGDTATWDWEYAQEYGEPNEVKQMEADYKQLRRIQKTIEKELNSKYVMFCEDCDTVCFYSRLPKYDVENYYCYKCKNNHLTLLPLEDWLKQNNIYNEVREYLKKVA